ncbi:hypothetical protein [Fodinicola feengrottensis]
MRIKTFSVVIGGALVAATLALPATAFAATAQAPLVPSCTVQFTTPIYPDADSGSNPAGQARAGDPWVLAGVSTREFTKGVDLANSVSGWIANAAVNPCVHL